MQNFTFVLLGGRGAKMERERETERERVKERGREREKERELCIMRFQSIFARPSFAVSFRKNHRYLIEVD